MKHSETASRAASSLAVVLSIAAYGFVSCETTTTPEPEPQLLGRVKPSGEALDLLLVITSSPGSGRLESLMDRNYGLLDVLFNPGDGIQAVVDLHAGVIDMDLGAGGYVYEYSTCGEHPSNGALRGGDDRFTVIHLDPPFVIASAHDEQLDLGTVAAELEGIARLGDVGCWLEQPLESLRLALTDRVDDGTNAGFFRQGAVLAVVILTDKDDCSALDSSFFDPDLDDLGRLDVRCFVHPDQLAPVSEFASLLLAQRPSGRVVTAGWLTVPQGWDGDVDVLRPDPALDWRTATEEDFELCPEVFRGMFKSPRLAEFMLLTGGEDLVWSMCDNSIYNEGMETIGRRILEHLDPVECLPSAPPEGSRCEVALLPLDDDDPCPESTTRDSPGVCSLRDDQWELVETTECTALRATPGLEVPPGAALEIRCTDAADSG